MLSTGVIQERVATPSTCTVQAPQSAIPQPNFVPVMPSTSRNTQRRGVSPSTSTLCVFLLTVMVKAMGPLRCHCRFDCRAERHGSVESCERFNVAAPILKGHINDVSRRGICQACAGHGRRPEPYRDTRTGTGIRVTSVRVTP